MNLKVKRSLKYSCIALLLCVMFAGGVWLGINKVTTESPVKINWQKHTSVNFRISFDYPSHWTVRDEIVTSTEGQMIPILEIDPPLNELVLNGKGSGNVIEFYDSVRLSRFPISFIDWLADVIHPINIKQGVTFLHVEKDSNNIWYLLGRQRIHDNRLLYVIQEMCEDIVSSTCVSTFNHVIDSIKLVEKS